jgi:hypothetical protein
MSRSEIGSVEEYRKAIASKAALFNPAGLKRVPPLHSSMFPHQQASTEFALRAGCAGLFLATGLGKSLCSLEWGRVIVRHTNKPVLMLAPLAVAKQHEREAAKFGIDAKAVREPREIDGKRIFITNYERMDKFDADDFGGVILDESGILKAYTGSTSRKLRAKFAHAKYRLAASATPAPNDHMEIGQQSEFLGIMESPEMLSRWFIIDQSEMGRYRMKAAARLSFWNWVASWSRCIDLPSDIGFADDAYVLPPINLKQHIVGTDTSVDAGAEIDGQARLFRIPDTSATSIHKEKRLTVADRADCIADIALRETNEPWVIWCDTDYEADALMERLPGFIEVRGSQSPEEKEEKLVAFSEGKVGGIITKPKLAGWGLNWQHCARMGFVGLSFSYEAFYQAARRCWRFGQTRPVDVHVAMATTEMSMWSAINRKAAAHDEMKLAMKAAMLRAHQKAQVLDSYQPTINFQPPSWLR